MNIYWYKLNAAAIIPTKSVFAAGFDIYTIEKDITIPPHSQHLFSTGLAVVPEGCWMEVKDRGSTGSKGLHVHCGVVDTDYRGEIFICIKNDNPYPVKFTTKEAAGLHSHKEVQQVNIGNSAAYQMAEVEIVDYLVYSTDKAIAQMIPIIQPQIESRELTKDEWKEVCNTERGEGKLGSSGK